MKILLIILSAIVAIYLLDTIDNIIVNVTRIKHLGDLDLKHCPFCGEPINKEEKHTTPATEDVDFDTWLENQPEGTFVQGGGIDEENSPKNDKKD